MKGIDPIAPFRQLIDRRLWPLAVLLLAGLLAVPLLLAKDGAQPVPMAATDAAAGAATAPAASSTQPVVSVAEAGDAEARRKVLGSAKDPFRPAPAPRSQEAETPEAKIVTQTASTGDTPAGGGGSSAPSGGPVGGGLPSPSVPVGQPPAAPQKVYELYSLAVRFGESSADRLERSNLKRLKALPNPQDPAVIYLGIMRDRKTAVFLVDAGTEVQGDGRCMPSPSNCQTLQLKVGETAFFDVTDEKGNVAAQYQLDVLKVMLRRTTDAQAAKRSMAAEARGGRASLRARMSRVGPYRYDARSGSLKRISRKAHRAAAARASAR